MNRITTWLTGAGIGAGLMYVLDPARGKRRRALVRDQIVHAVHQTQDMLDKAGRDLQNRTWGIVAATKSRLSREEISDEILTERVRATLGRVVSHPSAISVTVDQGRVTLTGPILAREVKRLRKTVSKVRGVKEVENQLETYQQAGDVPGLQGQTERPEPRFELMQENWTPIVRVLAVLGGGALAISGVRRGGLTGVPLGAFGLGLLGRGMMNLPLKRLIGVGSGRRGVDLQKTIHVEAPVEKVFEFWKNYENFPRFMANVEEVKDIGDGRSRWVVKGPASTTIEWEARTTSLVPNEFMAWRSLPGSTVRHAGTVHFEPDEDGGTRVHVRMTYRPPAGVVGHMVAGFFGSDPKQAMDEDLARFKSLIEQDKTTTEGQTIARESVTGEA